jgi:hypothetical protein
MSGACRAALIAAALDLFSLASSAARAESPSLATDLAKCAALTSPDTRLACFDALARRKAEGGSAAATSTPSSSAKPAAATTVAAAAAATVPSAAAAEDPANFGLEGAKAAHAPAKVQSIRAHIAQLAPAQMRYTYCVLDNGQTWQTVSGDMELNLGEAVTITRAALGSFLMVTPHHSYHVRRLK